MGRSVLVAGVSRYLGGRFARLLAEQPGVDRVIGVDVIAPPHDIGRAEFVRADIRNPMIGRIIEQTGVDTVVHMSVIATPVSAGGRTAQKEINVIGTMQLLAACHRAPALRRLVVKSTSAVYGSSPRDPAMFTETQVGKHPPRSGWGKDSAEVEEYVRGFSRRRPGVEVVTLRLANVIGPGIRTSMTDYFSLPVVPSVLGFDPRLQFLHEDDAVEAMRLATLGEAGGVINVAGDGVIGLGQAARFAGRPTVGVPPRLAGLMGSVYHRGGLADFSADQIRYLRFGRCLDTTRMREHLGLDPAYSTRTAFQDFVRTRGLRGPFSPEVVNAVEQQLVARLRPGRRPRAGVVR
ncbi:NAD-dependent epimerase/dehydratase family protein [Kineosporia sp. J2-2]|uniref:NAD-dependent epimerase/dehydratase family protein n=1 Tax=Kineosporia corallincola TaxID=2835133 RepID=A0ABS5TA48_9ACTN|nr:NAD-dependent epimerase/dehydratase family protein [Kineosporia corallincola]MBT0767738.1 NAD-dependent epimerase/dehydratase family protein [Kineosporia corallincola]